MISLNSPWLLKQSKSSKFWRFILIKIPFVSVGNLLILGDSEVQGLGSFFW